MSTAYKRVCLVLLLLTIIFGIPTCKAQTGIQPLGTYSSGADNVNVATLSVHYDIPLFTRKERGTGTDVLVHLVYDGGALSDGFDSTILGWGGTGWRLALDTSASASGHSTSTMVGNTSCPLIENPQDRYFSYTVADNSGYTHYFPFEGRYDGCTGNFTDLTSPVAATDGSGYLLMSTSYGLQYVIGTPSGGRIACTQSSDGNDICTTTDSNGNRSQIYLDLNDGLHFSDPAGSYLSITGTLGNIPNGVYFPSNPINISYKDATGATQTVTINTQGYSVYNPAMIPSEPRTGTFYFPSSVQFPDGTSYTFAYEPSARYSGNYTGRLASVKLPTGGTISYSYVDGPDRDADGFFNPYISSLTRTTADGSITYNNSRNGTYANSLSGLAWRQTTVNELSRTTVYSFVGALTGFLETSRSVYAGSSASGSPIQATTRCYNGATSNCASSNVNGIVTQIDTTTTREGVTSRTVEFLNSVSLPTEVDEYDFGASSPTKKTLTTYANIGNYISDRVQSVTVKDGNNQTVSQVSYGYDEYPLTGTPSLPNHSAVTGARGNRTSQHIWLNTTGGTIDTGWKYDEAGQVRGQMDGRGNWTLLDYDIATDSCLWKRTYPFTVSGASAPLSESATCNSYTGTQETATDMNGVVTTYSYDSMLRSSGTSTRDSGNTLQAQQTTTYSYSGGHEVVTTTTVAAPSPSITTTKTLDGYGRTYTESLANGATVDTRYDSLGRVHTVSNPYFSTSDPTYGVTTYGYDILNRQTSVLTSDGVSSTSSIPYGKTVTSKDESGNTYIRDYDVWGNLTRVQEPNGTQTSYTYNLLGNLVGVNQNGLIRSFFYDSASRLLASSNPETGRTQTCAGVSGGTWGICYSYDGNGNLQTKTDARGVTTNYNYDALNRLTQRHYSDGTQGATFFYDTPPTWMPDLQNTVGRLANIAVDYVQDRGVAAAFSYDSMGRVIRKWQQTPSMAPGGVFIGAGYDLAGNTISLTYPSGRQITKAYDSAGRLSSINAGPSNPGYAFVSSITYHPDGTPDTYVYGNGVSETISENSRLQICESRVYNSARTFIDKQYFYGTSNTSGQQCNAVAGNNGNIWNINDGLGGSYNQNFSYDALNRLTAWTAPNMAGSYRHLDYRYDSFGNMVQAATGDNTVPSSVYDSNNRLLSSRFNCYGKNGETGGYDAAGNTLCFGSQNTDAKAFVWDGDNRISEVWAQQNNNTYSQTASYVYDWEGQRIRANTTGGNWREYVLFNGQTLEEKVQDGSSSDYIYAGDKRVARADSYDQRIHLHGTRCSDCGWQSGAWVLPFSGYTVQSGDTISWRQYQYGTGIGGLTLSFTDGSNTNWGTSDTNGQVMNNLTTHNQWVNRTVDLSAFAGKTVYDSWIGVEGQTLPGDWDEWFGEIAITSTNGTVTPIYNRLSSISLFPFSAGGMTNLSANVERSNSAGDAALVQLNTTYYLGDHLGTTQLHFAAGGWPVWQGEFAPFGQEVGNQPTDNHYKFTGKERDPESGLDNFGARYFASSMGRFMSPDWSDSPDAVPYATLENPQSLNLYAYAGNNPISTSDADGHDSVHQGSSKEICSDGSIADVCASAKMTDPIQINPATLMQYAKATFNAVSNVVQTASNFIGTNQTLCKVATTVGGIAGGALSGGEGGALAGGAIGGTGGTLVAPGVGTLGGGAAGAGIGATIGGVTGGIAGGVAGYGAANAMCSSGGGGGRASGSGARLTNAQQRQTAKYLGMKEVKGLTSQGQAVFEKDGRYFSFSNTSHTAGEVFKEVDRSGNRIATTDLNFNRIGR